MTYYPRGVIAVNQSLKRITDLAALMVVTIWGVNFVFLKAALSEFDPLVFTWLRFAGMLVIGWSLLLAQHRAGKHGGALKIARADIPGFILSGVTGFTLYIVLSIIGLNYTTAFSNALLLAISPLFVALLLSAQRLERVRGGQWLAMGVSLGGVCIFLADKLQFGLVAASAGDLISLDGYLVSVSSDGGWRWDTSLSRTDTGNGACEIVWVKRLTIL